MKIRSLVVSVVLALGMILGGAPARAESHQRRAPTRTSASKPRASRSNPRTSRATTANKTVHVRAYTKKNGTHVAAHNRRPPSSRVRSSKPRTRTSGRK